MSRKKGSIIFEAAAVIIPLLSGALLYYLFCPEVLFVQWIDSLSSGRSADGAVYFEVPSDAKEIEIEYEYNLFSSKIMFAVE